MEIVITKIMVFVLVFAILNIVREIGTFYQCYKKLEKYEVSNTRLFGLWASISYIMTIIFTGF